MSDAAKAPKYSLYDCKEGLCKQTSGYIVSDTSIFAFVGTDAPFKIDFNPFVGIQAEKRSIVGEEGKLNENAQIRNGVFRRDIASNSLKILMRQTGAMGTPFYDENYSIPVKSDNFYMVRDQFYNKGGKVSLLHSL